MKRTLSYAVFIVGLSVPLGLGIWQLQRAEWKADILKTLDQEYNKEAGSYILDTEDIWQTQDTGFKLVSGSVQGEFISTQTLFWPTPLSGNYALKMMSPFQTQAGDIIMVERGSVFEDLKTKAPVEIIPVPIDTPLTLTGILRIKEHNYFTPENNEIQNRWYRFDTEQIVNYYNIDAPLSPFVFFAEEVSGTPENILGNIERVRIYPNNRHLQYAAFWGTLAALWASIIGWKITRKS